MSLFLAAVVLLPLASPSSADVRITAVRPGYWSAVAKSPVFKGSKVADAATAAFEREARSQVRQFVEQSKEFSQDAKPREPYFFEMGATITYKSPTLISGYFTEFWYTGGAHPNTVLIPISVGLVAGKAKVLHLQDLFRKGVDARMAASYLVIQKLRNNEDAAWVQNGDVVDLNKKTAEMFAIESSGLLYTFSPYEMGPYAVGSILVPIGWAEFSGQLDKDGPLKELLRK